MVVSVVHLLKGNCEGQQFLDGNAVDTITAFLFHDGDHNDPVRLTANGGKSFQGSIVLGMGFTFDDTDKKGVATPIAKMEELIDKYPNNEAVIAPYIGGQEVNTSPRHAYHRFVINFGDCEEAVCRSQWPELMSIVEDKVKPQRLRNNDGGANEMWWQFLRPRPELTAAIEALERVLVINCGATPHHAFAFLPNGMVYANSLAVFPFESNAAFCTLQSRPHEIWARFFGSSMKDDLRYTPSDCFETFPFPGNWETHAALEAAGKEYYRFRADLMVRNNEGMTTIYNRFHDPDAYDSSVVRLRNLHANMDRVVLHAYGWTDVPTDCEFLLDFEIDEEEYKGKKKPWRYRWPDAVRDDVLARLLALNGERAQLERIMAEQAVRAAKNELLKV